MKVKMYLYQQINKLSVRRLKKMQAAISAQERSIRIVVSFCSPQINIIQFSKFEFLKITFFK